MMCCIAIDGVLRNMANFDYHIDEGDMDKVLENLSKHITRNEAYKINKPAAQVFEKALKKNIMNGNQVRPLRHSMSTPPGEHGKWDLYNPDRTALINSLAINKEKDGAAKVGVTKKSKKAYIARFLNDGWSPRNQFGGPYKPVPGEHFWEKTSDEVDEEVRGAELKALKEYLYYKAKGVDWK